MRCRNCGNESFQEVLDLITSPPSNALLTRDALNAAEVHYPLKLLACESCWLVQLSQIKSPRDIFGPSYVYFSSFSETWKQHCKEFVAKACERFALGAGSTVIEIGSNDGQLLRNFPAGVRCLGIDPSEGPARAAQASGIETRVEFFTSALAGELRSEGRTADLLILNNVMAHVPELHDFIAGLSMLIADKGVISVEVPYLANLIDGNQFDTIYHEHYSYFSFKCISELFAAHGLTVFDVEELPTHGGSLRVFAQRSSSGKRAVSETVFSLLSQEVARGLESRTYYDTFKEQVQRVRREFLQFVVNADREGKSVAGYGAAAKATTFLNYCGIKAGQIRFIADKSPHKQGMFLPGSRVPIVSVDYLLAEQPDYIVIFPWNIESEIVRELSAVRSWNGQFVVAIPHVRIF